MIRTSHLLRAGFVAAALLSSSLTAATVNGVLQKAVHVKERYPTDNFGNDTILQVSSKAGYQKVIYLQFSVSGIPAGATGISAQVRLRSQTTTSVSTPITARPVSDTSWSETAITWNARPAIGGTSLSTISNHVSGQDSAWAVGGHVTGNGTFALALNGGTTSDTTFTSEDGGVAPTLVVTYTPPSTYFVYRGNTHSHTSYTSSHGSVAPAQGPPSEHHSRAKAAGFDFYATTDHSQEVAFNPTSVTNPAWVDTKNAAAAATDSTYVGLAGFEHSENDNHASGDGHINVINSNAYTDASDAGMDLPAFYAWLGNAAANGSDPVVASFNHPGTAQYGNWANRTAAATNVITLLEVVSSGDTSKEASWRAANNAGWKVGATCGIDRAHEVGDSRRVEKPPHVRVVRQERDAALYREWRHHDGPDAQRSVDHHVHRYRQRPQHR
jgi:hypothetical protein